MTELTATVFDNEAEALNYSTDIIGSLGLEAVIKPARLVQIIYPNQLHQVEKGWVVITPAGNGLSSLQNKAKELEDKAKEKYDSLKEQLAQLESQHGFADE